MPPRAATPPDFRQHLEVETPEHVVIDYEIAGLGSRALAAGLDTLVILLILLAIVIAMALAGRQGSRWGTALVVVAVFALQWGYFTLFEGLWRGRTPGKRAMGIRVIRDTGHGLEFGDAAARNLLRAADFLPPPYLLGAILVAVHPRGKRLGDMVAGTVVVRDQPSRTNAPPEPETALEESDSLGTPELSDEEFRVVREFSERSAALPAATRQRLAEHITARFSSRYPDRPASAAGFLAALHRDEAARRRGRYGASVGGGRGGERSARSVAERLIARKSPRWQAFQVLAERVSRQGLDGLAADELPDFARRYRELAADLARARTYRADPIAIGRLERLVAAGHNALYRERRRTWGRILRFVARDCPAAVVASRRYVALAFLVFALPALGGYALLRERPALAPELLPDVMLERAEAGAARVREGLGYFESGTEERPLVATSIIGNNISVAFNCFAGGIFGGVGSLVFLAFNGLQIGAASGHFANVGLLDYLWTFIVGHGVLELFAIWVAGAAGFLLGRALIAPGEYSRRDALVLAGRRAIPLIGAVIVFLLIAGSIEGFLSSSDAPAPIRLLVSGASLLFLVLYLANGARQPGAPEGR